MTPRRALVILIISSALVRLIAASALGLGNDEAYHYLYAVHPSLSYYDHPPLMAWVEMAGLSLAGGQAPTWALRIGFIALFAGSTWLLAQDHDPVLRRIGRIRGGVRSERDGILRSGRRDLRSA